MKNVKIIYTTMAAIQKNVRHFVPEDLYWSWWPFDSRLAAILLCIAAVIAGVAGTVSGQDSGNQNKPSVNTQCRRKHGLPTGLVLILCEGRGENHTYPGGDGNIPKYCLKCSRFFGLFLIMKGYFLAELPRVRHTGLRQACYDFDVAGGPC